MSSETLELDEHGFPLLSGQPLRLPPKARAALALLLQRRPAVVPKDAFAQVAWRDGPMSDESLARCISQLRRALQSAGWGVESVYGTGYRLSPVVDAAAIPTPRATGHPRLTAAAQANPGTVDAYLHARQLAQQRTPEALDRAISLLRELRIREPVYTPAAVALAEALAAAVGWGQRDTDAAVAEGLAVLDAARITDPDTPGLAAARGALLDMAWRFDEAALAHAEALALGHNDPDTLVLHARHLLFTDQAEAAIAPLRHACALAPHSPMLRMTLSRALVQAGFGDAAMAEADAARDDHPGQLLLVAFALAMRAMAAPEPALEAQAQRLTEGRDTPPFVWTVLAFVLARLGRRGAALDIIDTVLLCSATTTGEACLYAAPLAALGDTARAAALLQRAADERCGMLALVLRDPAHAGWLRHSPAGQALLSQVFGATRHA